MSQPLGWHFHKSPLYLRGWQFYNGAGSFKDTEPGTKSPYTVQGNLSTVFESSTGQLCLLQPADKGTDAAETNEAGTEGNCFRIDQKIPS